MQEQSAPGSSDFKNPADKLVLLVDDDESLLDLMDHVVRKEGFRTALATDGAEAIKKVQALRPDFILLDFMLPGRGGHEVARDLQALGLAAIPIVMVTGRQLEPQDVEKVKNEPNVKEFMQKPLRPVVLAATLHRLLGTRPLAANRPSGLSGGVS